MFNVVEQQTNRILNSVIFLFHAMLSTLSLEMNTKVVTSQLYYVHESIIILLYVIISFMLPYYYYFGTHP